MTHIYLNVHLYVRGKLTKAGGRDLRAADYTAVTNNFLHSLFSQCTITHNGVTITRGDGLYPYRAYLETLLTYGVDVTSSNLSNAF
jgi:hypothetical protein